MAEESGELRAASRSEGDFGVGEEFVEAAVDEGLELDGPLERRGEPVAEVSFLRVAHLSDLAEREHEAASLAVLHVGSVWGGPADAFA